MSNSWPLGRRWVVAGFALIVVAEALDFILQVHWGLFSGFMPRSQVETVASLLATAASLGAWWWLSALDADGPQGRIVVRGYLVIAAQQLLFALQSVLSLTTPNFSVDPLVKWAWGLQCAGALAVAVGLAMLAFGWPTRDARAGVGDEDWPEEMDDPEVEAEAEGESA